MTTTRNLFYKTFRTQKYKSIYYPVRPWLTLGYISILLILIAANVISLGWIAGFIIASGLDDLSIFPFLRLVQSAQNLMYKHKIGKALFTLLSVSLGLIAGSVIGFYFLAASPLVTAWVTLFTTGFGSSLVVTAVGMILGSVAARAIKIPSFYGMAIFGAIASLLPITLPVVVETVFLGMTAGGFLASIAAKVITRTFYHIKYGDSNADGYHENFSKDEIQVRNQRQANLFGVTANQFQALLNFCREKIKTLKAEASIILELVNERRTHSNSFKDIHHLLVEAKDAEDKRQLQELLAVSLLRKNQIEFYDLAEKEHYQSTVDQIANSFEKEYENAVADETKEELEEPCFVFIRDTGLIPSYINHRRLMVNSLPPSKASGFDEAAEPFLVENTCRLAFRN